MSLKPLKKTDACKWWAARKDRKAAVRSEVEYILVASEDGKSSVYYFEELNKRLRAHSATLEVIPKGVGKDTQDLVEYVQKNRGRWLAELRKEVDVDDFDEVWVLFDRDDFKSDKFDNAIVSAGSDRNRFKVAWSNECFELWYLLHFRDQVTGIDRHAIYEALGKCLNLEGSYEKLKGDKGRALHAAMANHLGVGRAIKRARRLHENVNCPPHEANPCTLVYLLVEKLLKQIV